MFIPVWLIILVVGYIVINLVLDVIMRRQIDRIIGIVKKIKGQLK